MDIFKKAFRGVLGLSPAAVVVGFRHGQGSAYQVLSKTLQAYDHTKSRSMDLWDVVRAFSAEDDIKLHANHWMDGATTALERFVMALLIKFFEPRIIVEIGTFRGISTRVILDNMKDSAKVFTVDLPEEIRTATKDDFSDERLIKHRVVGCDYKSHPLAGNVTQIFGDSFDERTWDNIPVQINFAFIDASHTYEAVKNDTEKLWPKLAKDAVVVWHDYTEGVSQERGVGKYLRELMNQHDDVFICEQTSLGLRVPKNLLLEATKKIESFSPDGSYRKRKPKGATPWLSL